MSERKLRTMKRAFSSLALLALWGSADEAAAQLRLDRYMAPPSPNDGLRVSRPVGLDEGQLGGLVVLDYADDPLVMELERGLDETETTRLVNHQLEAHARVAYGITERLMLSGGLDFAVMMVGESYDDQASGTTLAPADGAGLGDAHVGARYVLLGSAESAGALALDAKVILPLAKGANSDQRLSGEQGVAVHPELIGEVRSGPLRVTGNFGVMVRKDATLLDTKVGDELTAGIGASARLPGAMHEFDVMAEVYGATGISDPFSRNVTPVEAIIGGRWHPSEQWLVSVGAGPGMGRGIGSPDVRAIASVGFVGGDARDSDNDMIIDDVDACPTDMEDRDGVNDQDGCPDTDDDGDAVHDPLDRCPAQAEDKDAFEDEDGCPDVDNDQDGVSDTVDACIGPVEDKDGFQDEDGCPDADNDQDSVPDGADSCPDQAEDVDSFQDNDGCPDTDNDGDGVMDASDACPTTPGTTENKGCAKVVVEGNQIRLNQRIEFETNGAELLPESEAILEEIRALLEKNPQIESVAIEGHTDSTGRAAHNQTLSQRRALSVVDWLVRHGVAAERLQAVGCGSNLPLEDESTNEGRRKNRRVELHILESGATSIRAQGCVQVPYRGGR